MACGTTYLGFYGIIGVLLALYSIHFAEDEPQLFFFNIGLFPLGIMAISELNILDACTTNVLGSGLAALLLLGYATLAFGKHNDLK